MEAPKQPSGTVPCASMLIQNTAPITAIPAVNRVLKSITYPLDNSDCEEALQFEVYGGAGELQF